ncbi:hypothetical protein Tco_0190549 [Tanacetum coccineum]
MGTDSSCDGVLCCILAGCSAGLVAAGWWLLLATCGVVQRCAMIGVVVFGTTACSSVVATAAGWLSGCVPAAAKLRAQIADHRMLAQELDASSGWVIIKDKTVDSAALFHDLYNDMENLGLE